MPDDALAFGGIADAELLTGRVVAYPEGFAHDQRLELRISQCRRALRLQVGHGHAGGRILAGIGSGCVPDGRRPGSFLSGERNHVRRSQAGLDCLDEGPARRGDFQHASVVERMQAGIEFRIGPDGLEFGRTHGVGVGGFLQVHGALNRRNPARPLVRLAFAGPDNVENLLEALAVLGPALDDLNAIKIAGSGVFYRPDHERRGRALQWRQVSAHGHAVGIGLVYPVAGVQDVFVVAPSAEEADFNVRAADAEGLLAIHGVPEGRARVFLGPDTGEAAGIFQSDVQGAKRQNSGQAPVGGSVDLSVTAVEVILAVRTAGIVRVGAARHAELVRVVATYVLHGDAVFVGLPGEAALNVIDAATGRRLTQQTVLEELVTGELVIGREQGMSFRLSLNLFDLNEAFVAVARGSPSCRGRRGTSNRRSSSHCARWPAVHYPPCVASPSTSRDLPDGWNQASYTAFPALWHSL